MSGGGHFDQAVELLGVLAVQSTSSLWVSSKNQTSGGWSWSGAQTWDQCRIN